MTTKDTIRSTIISTNIRIVRRRSGQPNGYVQFAGHHVFPPQHSETCWDQCMDRR